MRAQRAGILLYRNPQTHLEVLLTHPGGPFWSKRDDASWMIPKGGVNKGEDPFRAALRELEEEIGLHLSGEGAVSLGQVRQRGGKLVSAWAIERDFDPRDLKSMVVRMEWPPRSGRMREFPEVDRVEWFDIEQARRKILPAQEPLLDRLLDFLSAGS